VLASPSVVELVVLVVSSPVEVLVEVVPSLVEVPVEVLVDVPDVLAPVLVLVLVPPLVDVAPPSSGSPVLSSSDGVLSPLLSSSSSSAPVSSAPASSAGGDTTHDAMPSHAVPAVPASSGRIKVVRNEISCMRDFVIRHPTRATLYNCQRAVRREISDRSFVFELFWKR